MGRQLKKKDPSKKKKKTVDDSAAVHAVAKQNKNGVAAKAIAGVSARLKAKQPGASTTKPAKQNTTTGIRGYVNQGVQFLKEVQIELKKVYWPSRKQAAGSTAVVIVLVILVSLFLGMADFGLSNIMQLILG